MGIPGAGRALPCPGARAPRRLPVAGLVTNEYASRRPGAADARTDPDWLVTSGSLFARWACGWTGVPDGDSPGPDSRRHTGSAVFRLVSRRRDFGDVGCAAGCSSSRRAVRPGRPLGTGTAATCGCATAAPASCTR
ncbi:hypothetical protein NKH77_31475 [Streptomyces sp. M19]